MTLCVAHTAPCVTCFRDGGCAAQIWLEAKEELEGQEGVQKMKLFKASRACLATSVCCWHHERALDDHVHLPCIMLSTRVVCRTAQHMTRCTSRQLPFQLRD